MYIHFRLVIIQPYLSYVGRFEGNEDRFRSPSPVSCSCSGDTLRCPQVLAEVRFLFDTFIFIY